MRLRLPTLTVVPVVLLAGALPSVASATTTQPQAQRAALTALGAASGRAPLIVFRGPALKPGTRIAMAGQLRLPLPRAGAARSRDRLLHDAGAQVVRAPPVVRVGGEPAWLFYADEAPYQAYQHPGRVVLVGERSGRVTVSGTLQWPPLIEGRLPYFLRSYSAYRNPATRAFVRLWRPVVRARPSAASVSALAAVAPIPTPTPGMRAAAAQLAAEHSCVVRVGDTLGNFYDASSFDQTRASFGAFFNQLADLDHGFQSVRYRVNSDMTLERFVARLVGARGCRDVLLYVAGGGYVNGGEPAVSVGIQGRANGTVEQQVVTGGQLRAIALAHPQVTFKLQLDAPGSGALLQRLRGLPNLLLFLASSAPGQASFTALPAITAADGLRLPNRYNADQLLEFSNRGLRGLRCFVADPSEVASAAEDKAAGRSRSFLAAMMWRAYELCGDGSLLDLVQRPGAAPVLRLLTPSPIPAPPSTPAPPVGPPATPPVSPPDGPPVTPPGPKNANPFARAVAVTTAEDTPVAVKLAGTDPDGDAMTYALAGQPAGGTVSGGDGPDRTFTPDPDFHGTTSFDYTVTDARGASATATVTVTVTPVPDAPVVAPGDGVARFVEDAPPVAVAPALTLHDADGDMLDSATVTIADRFASGEDELQFTDGNGIVGRWNGSVGVLTLVGPASAAAYEAALRSVAYRDTSQTPATVQRTLAFSVTDATGLDSATATRALDVVDVNEAPRLSGGGNAVGFTEDDPLATVNPGLTIADDDDAQLTGATVRISAGLAASEDALSFTGTPQISGSYDAATGTLRLTGDAPLADYETALQSVRYGDGADEDPTAGARTISFAVNDGEDESAAVTTTLTVTAVDDAPVLSGGGNTAAFVEGDTAGVVVDPGITVTDVDSARLAGATVTIEGFRTGEDSLGFVTASGINASYDGITGTLVLGGDATLADYETVLRSVRYAAIGDAPSNADRTIEFIVTGGGLTSNVASSTVTVRAVNDAPVVTAGGGAPSYAEGDATGVVIDPALTAADADDAQLAGATVTIASGFDASGDELRFTDQLGIAGSYDAGTGVLTLTGAAPLGDYETALRSIRFRSTGANPSGAPRGIAFVARDGTDASAPATTTVTVDLTDDPPVVVASGGAAVWSGSDVAVDPGLTVSDSDSADISGATVQITGSYQSSEDALAFSGGGAISGSFDAISGTLTLSGPAPLADYQAALRAVAYRHAGALLVSTPRTISFTVSNTATSNTATKQLAFAQPPAIDLPGGGIAYTEGDPAAVVEPLLTVTDPDSARLAGATIAISGGYASGEDVLAATTSGTSISAGYAAGTLTLSGDDTVADYERVLRTVTYEDTSEDPSTAPRELTFTVNDGLISRSDTTTVTVVAVDDGPVLTAGGATAAYVEDDTTGVPVDPAIAVSDVDSARLASATVAISVNLDTGGDQLVFAAPNGISGSYGAGTGVLSLTGDATVADYQAALRSIRFRSTDTADPPTATRTVRFTVSDGTTSSAPVTTDVTVTAVDDAPELTSGATLDYTENDAATAIDPALTLTDVDSASIAGASVEIGAGHAAGEDVLDFVNSANITGSFNSATGRLTLSGTDTVAAYQAALRSVRYSNSSDDPSTADRTITFHVDAGAGFNVNATATVTVRAVDDAPTAAVVTTGTVGNTQLAYGTSRPSGRAAAVVSGSVLDGAADVDSPGPFAVDPATSSPTGSGGGSVSWNADGSFDYVPAAGFTGTETLTYRLFATSASALEASGTVDVIVAGQAWYVDNRAAGGGDGRSSAPFDALVEAAAVAGGGDTVYVFRGDGTATGLGGGISLGAGERLLGEERPLTVGGTDLYDGVPGSRPRLAGVVQVAGAVVTVAGLALDGSIVSNSGGAGGTLAALAVDSGAATALRLDRTSGAWDLSDLAITTGGGDGLVADTAGTVAFAPGSAISIDAGTGGRALALSGTRTSGQIDSVTAAGAPGDAISLVRETGALTLDDIDVTASATGLLVDDATGVVVNPSGDASVRSAGAAVQLLTQSGAAPATADAPQVALRTVTSTGGAYGIRIDDVGAATFSASGGSLSGATSTAFYVQGGSGDVSYGGQIGDGSGSSVSILNRTAGAVTLSGTIVDGSDSGGGISLTSDSGGSTTFSGAGTTLQTGSSSAVTISGSQAVAFTGGGLRLATTSGSVLRALSGGTVAVTGTGNTAVSTAAGTAVTIDGPDIAASGVTFERVGSTGAPNGILLRDTGSAGGLHVTGDGTPGSGGSITGSSGAGISLTNTTDVQLASIDVRGGGDDGIGGSGVAGLALTGGSEVSGNGNAATESGIDLADLTGTVTLTGATITGNAYRDVQLGHSGGTLDATVRGGSYGATAASATGDDALYLESTGAGSASMSVSGATFAQSAADQVQVTTDGDATATQRVTIANSTFTNTVGQPGGGITLNPGGSSHLLGLVQGNQITGARLEAITITTPGTASAPQPVEIDASVLDNRIGTAGTADSGASAGNGIGVRATGNAAVRADISTNTILQFSNFTGIRMVQQDGAGTLDARVSGNTITAPSAAGLNTINVVTGGATGVDNGATCLDANGNTLTRNGVDPAVVVRERDATNVRLPGYGGGGSDTTALAAFVAGSNGGASASFVRSGTGLFLGGVACAVPTPP